MPLNWGYSAIRAQSIAAKLRRAGLGGKHQNLPVIYLPGILGTKLYDRQQQKFIWGDSGGFFARQPYEYLDSEAHRTQILASEQLHAFTIVPGLLHTLVTAELKRVLQTALGYQEGQDLFFLGHDWRADHRRLADRLDAEVQRLKALFGADQKIVLIGQSASNLAVRYWLRNTTAENRETIAKWYSFGPPWQGTFHALSMMDTGYYAATRYLHGFSADDIASYPSAYQLLPPNPSVIDIHGQPLKDFDIYDPQCWQHYQMGPYRASGAEVSPQCQRVRNSLGQNLLNAKAFAASIAGASPLEQTVPQVWYLSDNNQAVKAAVYHRQRWYFQANSILRDVPQLASQTLAAGDDHLPLSGLLTERCGPVVRDTHHQPWGQSYIYVSQARTHRALINHTPNLQSLAFDLAVERQKRLG
ncbi:lipase/acyltransferase domain-containing protein [Budvicia diplopodorum]|uniref:lipase/acyltransferase domain-containing protein n=1 Tax=Budvicia diplopodorum TaxID=1119056 RepID=UPI00135C3EB0|nr:hypothetical protein [Budvicia diplopodorum]